MPKRACKTILEPELLTGTLGSFACRSLAHCPSKDFGTWVRVNSMVDTFQTRNGHLWLLSLREGQLDLLFEAAAAEEQHGVQGGPSWVVHHLSKRQFLEAVGNSLSMLAFWSGSRAHGAVQVPGLQQCPDPWPHQRCRHAQAVLVAAVWRRETLTTPLGDPTRDGGR